MIKSHTYVAIPPGKTIKDQLSFREMSQKEFALRMDLTEKHVTNLLNGKVRLTPNVAIRLELVLGVPATFWENLEAVYRETLIKVADENQMTEDYAAVKNFPYAEMAKYGWVPHVKKPSDKVIALRKFFEVVNLQLINEPQINRIACRRLSFSNAGDFALIAWAQKAKLDARNIDTHPINLCGLKSAIPSIRAMSTMSPVEFCPKLIDLFRANGVALVFLPHLKSSSLHGASFYDGKKIVIGLTVRGKYADKFWFSMFHEIAHILYGHIGQADGTSENDEKKADLFASETLIPSKSLKAFILARNFTDKSLRHFADSINIDVGILVGRLQHEHILKQNQFNYLKKKYELQ